MDILLPEFKQLLLLLSKHKVNHMLIGGYAVIHYGYERSTTDMDIWLEPSNENRIQVIAALNEFGIDENSLCRMEEIDFTDTQFFFFGKKPRRIDFLTRINNLTWEEAAEKVNYFSLGDQQIPIIQYQHLILSKISNDRAKDKADVEELQRINRHEDPL